MSLEELVDVFANDPVLMANIMQPAIPQPEPPLRPLPTVFLIRDGEHKLSERDPEGVVCENEAMSTIFRLLRQGKRVHLFSSPLRRAINTALGLFAPAFNADPDALLPLLPLASEVRTTPADQGSPRSQLLEQYPKVDASNLTREDWYEDPLVQSTAQPDVDTRAQNVRRFLREQNADAVVLVSHSIFLKDLTRDMSPTEWSNNEIRVYHFSDTESASQSAYLSEDRRTAALRRLTADWAAQRRRRAIEQETRQLEQATLHFQG